MKLKIKASAHLSHTRAAALLSPPLSPPLVYILFMQPEETPQTCRPHLRGVSILLGVHVVYQCRIGLKVQFPGDTKMFREPPKKYFDTHPSTNLRTVSSHTRS